MDAKEIRYTMRNGSSICHFNNQWCVESKNGLRFLISELDFLAAYPLLEIPLSTVKDTLRSDFPYDKLLESAVYHGSMYWLGKAFEWFVSMPKNELIRFLPIFKKIKEDQGYPQKYRHQSMKLQRKIENNTVNK